MDTRTSFIIELSSIFPSNKILNYNQILPQYDQFGYAPDVLVGGRQRVLMGGGQVVKLFPPLHVALEVLLEAAQSAQKTILLYMLLTHNVLCYHDMVGKKN